MPLASTPECSGDGTAPDYFHKDPNNNILAAAEDIGRHNTLDNILGECLLKNLSTADKLLLTTGRISSEMLSKAARMKIPIVVSRNLPTDRLISLAITEL